MAGTITWRVQLGGADQARSDFKSLGDAGAQAARTTADSWVQAGTQTDAEITRTQRLGDAWRQADAERRQYAAELRSSGANPATTSLQRDQASAAAVASAAQAHYNQTTGVSGQAGKSARDSATAMAVQMAAMEQMQARAASLRAALDPLVGAQQKYGSAVRSADELLAAGVISQVEYASAVGAARKALEEAEKAALAAGSGFHLTSLQAMELEHSARAMVDAVMAGRNPLQALSMESGRLVQALGQGEGVGAALSALTALVSAPVVAIAGLTTAMLAGVAAAGAYAHAQEQLEVSLTGAGRRSGETAEGLERIAEVGGRAGDVSVSAARGIEEAFLATGRISASVFPQAISIQRDFATAMGLTSKAATGELAKSLADPARGAEQLNQSLAFLNDAELQQIRTMEEAGQRTEAQQLLLDRLRTAVGGAAESLNPLDQALHNLSTNLQNAWNWTGQLIDKLNHLGSTKLQSLNLQIAIMQSAPLHDADQLKQLMAERDAIVNAPANKARADANEASTRTRAIVGQYDPVVQQKLDMQAQLDDLRVQAAKGFPGVSKEDRPGAERLLQALPRAIATAMSQHEKEVKEAGIRAQMASRPGSARRGQLQEQLARLQVAGQVLTPDEANSVVASGRLQGENRGARVDQSAARRAEAEANRAEAAEKASNDTIFRAQEAQAKAEESISTSKASEAKSALEAAAGDATLSASERRARTAQAASDLALQNAKDDRLRLELRRIEEDRKRQLSDVDHQKDWTDAQRENARRGINTSSDAQVSEAREQDRARLAGADATAAGAGNQLQAAALKSQASDLGLPTEARARAEQQLLELQEADASARLEETLAVKGVTAATAQRARAALSQSQAAELQLATDTQARQFAMNLMEATKSLATSQDQRSAIEQEQLRISQQQRAAATQILVAQLDQAVSAGLMAKAERDRLASQLTSARTNLDSSEQEVLRRQQLSPLGKLYDPSQQTSPRDMAQADAAQATDRLSSAFVQLEMNTARFGNTMREVVSSLESSVLKQLTDRALAPVDRMIDQGIDKLFPSIANTGTAAANTAMAQSATAATSAITALAQAAATAATRLGFSGGGANGGLFGFNLGGASSDGISFDSLQSSGQWADFDSLPPFAGGGLFRGPGSPTSDAATARISDGEYIVNARATAQHLPALEAINSGRLPGYASGGYYGDAIERHRRTISAVDATLPASGSGGSGGGDVHLHNHGGQPLQASTSKGSNGDMLVTLTPLFEKASRGRATDPNGLVRDLRNLPKTLKTRVR